MHITPNSVHIITKGCQVDCPVPPEHLILYTIMATILAVCIGLLIGWIVTKD